MASGHQAEVSARIARLSEAARLILCGGEGGGCLHTDARDSHEDLAGLRMAGDDVQAAIFIVDPIHQMPGLNI